MLHQNDYDYRGGIHLQLFLTRKLEFIIFPLMDIE